MNRCDYEDGERFVAGLLSPAEETSFLEHLDTCSACRQELEEIAGDDQDWQTIRELLTYSCAKHRRRDPTPPAQNAPADMDEVASACNLSFLGPTDDTEMIGRIGPYEIRGVLGRGGFGLVLKGHDRALDRIVAIKILDPATALVAAARERFAREARAMASISHEHVVPVYAVDTHAGLPYFVMEYVAGGSLERRLKMEGRCDVVSIVRIGLQIAQALSAAHRQGLVHRDIKPANILLDRGTERVRVADFGLARVASEVSSTRSGFVAGTPQYMAPEQVRGETCDAQSDLFSLGAVMYALCTGHSPFRADSVYGVMQRIVHDEPRGIREQNPAIPAWLERFVLRLLEKNLACRFSSSEEVARLLQDELAHLQNPALTQQPNRDWSGKPAAHRRVRSWFIPAGGAALVVLLIVAGVTAYWSRAGRQAANRAGANHSSTAATEVVNRSADEVVGPDEVVGLTDAQRATPLWAVDATRDALELAAHIEVSWHLPTENTAPDIWTQHSADLRRRLQALSWELDRENPSS
jgi:serine/threonine protein kinase